MIYKAFAVRTGLEPATPCVTGMYSNQLNYRTVLTRRFSRTNSVSFNLTALAARSNHFYSTGCKDRVKKCSGKFLSLIDFKILIVKFKQVAYVVL